MNISYEDYYKLYNYTNIDLTDESYLEDEERLRYIISKIKVKNPKKYFKEEIEKIKQKFEELSKDYDYLLIEGAGGITCPLRLENGEKYLLKDLIKELETSIIIVADGGLGTINSTLLTVEYARANNIPIAGIILNNFNPDSFMHQDNLKQVEYLTGIKVVATVERGQKDIKLLEELWTGRKKI